MFYVKPPDVRYVDMAIWIDENAYKEDCDVNQLFEYLYFLALMLAHKAKYFKKSREYEDFAIFMASRAYFRLTNKKQFEYEEDGSAKMTKLKSILNYMKSILYPCKVDFQQQFYAQTEISLEDTNYYSEYFFEDRLIDSIDELQVKEFELCLNDVVNTCKHFLKKIPYKTDSVEWYNIYTSCMLSLLNSITLDNKTIRRINNFVKNKDAKENFYINLYNQESQDCTILYHLSNSMKDYITVLIRQLKHEIAKDLSLSYRTLITPSKGLEASALSILNSSLKGGKGED